MVFWARLSLRSVVNVVERAVALPYLCGRAASANQLTSSREKLVDVLARAHLKLMKYNTRQTDRR